MGYAWKSQSSSQPAGLNCAVSKSGFESALLPQVLKLVAEKLFRLDEELLRKWGEVFWRRMCDAYLRLHASAFVKQVGRVHCLFQL